MTKQNITLMFFVCFISTSLHGRNALRTCFTLSFCQFATTGNLFPSLLHRIDKDKNLMEYCKYNTLLIAVREIVVFLIYVVAICL
jgi:hypothetical protein